MAISQNRVWAGRGHGPFSVEFWVKPTVNGYGNAQCPLHNRASTQPNGNGDRTGWDWFQRDQTTGWNWRLFNGSGGTRVFDLTGGPYTVGQWQHIVGVYDASVPLLVDNAAWAIGARGRWKSAFGIAAGAGFPDRTFAGAIDEVSVFDYGLSASQVAAHYSAGLLGAHPLTITPSGTSVMIKWLTGTLQEATSVTGPYNDVGAISPYIVPATGTMLYRIRL